MTAKQIEFPDPENFDDLPEGDGLIVISSGSLLLSANLQAERILKSRLVTGRRLPLESIFNPNFLPQAELAVREALHTGVSSSELEAEVLTGTGQSAPVAYSTSPLYDEKDRIIGVALTLRDQVMILTPHGGAPAAGLEFGSIFENLAEGVFTINTRWRITSFNQRASEITGFKREEVLGRLCRDIFQSDMCRSGCPLRSTLETGVIRMDQDVRIVSKEGRRMSILVNTSVIRDRRSNIIGAVETFRPLDPMGRNSPSEVGRRRPLKTIGQSPELTDLLDKLPDVAMSDASVVIEGESGTGKELLARSIHAQSHRASGPFVAVNTTALAESLLESELFGHEKAAFTGAVDSKVGRFELARGGTLFLDEVAEIKPEIQVKLLRVLQERVFERVGGTRPIAMDARIVSATNRNLIREVRAGRFREDLFYRLMTVPLFLPALRDRAQDIPLLVDHFITQFNLKYNKHIRAVDPKVIAIFQRYSWPGNIRELERVLEYAFVFAKGSLITPALLPSLDEPEDIINDAYGMRGVGVQSTPLVDEREAIVKALEKTGGKRLEAARILGISRSSLWRKMKTHGL